MSKLQNVWSLRQTMRVEGVDVTMGDFVIRMGTPSVSGMKGLLIELDYTPVTMEAGKLSSMFAEFLQLSLGSFFACLSPPVEIAGASSSSETDGALPDVNSEGSDAGELSFLPDCVASMLDPTTSPRTRSPIGEGQTAVQILQILQRNKVI